jgi:hypothetical protein
MVHIAQAVLSFLASIPWQPLREPSLPANHDAPNNISKTVVVVGAGSGGLASLKALLDLPPNVRANWEVLAYEQRSGVGGVWLSGPNDTPKPPALPETPLYPALHTNTPVPVMTFPGFPFPAGTPLYPNHTHIRRYHEAYSERFNLTSHIRFRHEVLSANWHGTSEAGWWDLVVKHEGRLERKRVDHLVVANGHNHYPHYANLPGLSTWLSGGAGRDVSHSLYFRTSDKYANRTTLVIGGGSSGRDVARQISAVSTTYQSLKPADAPNGAAGGSVKPVPIVAYLNASSVVFVDGTALHDVDAIVLATGYDLRIPFLSPPHSSAIEEVLPTSHHIDSSTARSLVTNQRYLFPLHEHVFSLSPAFPPTALAIVGLPIGVANCFSDSAQALYVAHALADPVLLGTREEMLSGLLETEHRLNAIGHDVYNRGHRLTAWPGHSHDYADQLVGALRGSGAPPYTEPWRRWAWDRPTLGPLSRAWVRVRELGPAEEQRWTAEAHTEDGWVHVMRKLAKWQEEWEEEHGIFAEEYVDVFLDY